MTLANSVSLALDKAQWNRCFTHLGDRETGQYSHVLKHTTESISQLFWQADKPYSGLCPEQLSEQVNAIDLDGAPKDLCDVVTDVVQLVGHNSILVQHPNCIAHLHTPPLISSIAAEGVIAALNQSMDSWDQASAATYVEQKVVDWLCQIYGLETKVDGSNLESVSDGVFTSGGTQSNQMGLLLARDWAVEKISNHNIQKNGLPEYASRLRIICSSNTHFTVQKSASIMGLGERAVICVDSLPDGSMNIEQLELTVEQLKRDGLIPFALVATAGTTDHGAIDNIDAMATIAGREGLWLHVDGAYGGALILSSHKSRLKGIERADSISVDFHKLFYQTISCGAILVKDKRNFKYLLHHADYLNREHDTLPNLVDKTLATTKRFDALKVFITMQSVGKDTLGAMYDHLLDQTQQVAELVAGCDGFELLAKPSLSTVLFRVSEPSDSDLDSLNQLVRIEALTRGHAVLGETTIDGKSALKFTILNPCLEMSDFKALLNKISVLADELAK